MILALLWWPQLFDGGGIDLSLPATLALTFASILVASFVAQLRVGLTRPVGDAAIAPSVALVLLTPLVLFWGAYLLRGALGAF